MTFSNDSVICHALPSLLCNLVSGSCYWRGTIVPYLLPFLMQLTVFSFYIMSFFIICPFTSYFLLFTSKKLCYSYGKEYNDMWRSKGLDHLCQDSDDDEMESTDIWNNHILLTILHTFRIIYIDIVRRNVILLSSFTEFLLLQKIQI